MALSSLAAAQPADFGMARSSRPVRIMIGGGASVPTGDLSNIYETGYNVQGSLLINFAGFPINLRTDVNYSQLKLKDLLATPGASAYGDNAAKLFGGLVNLTVPLGAGPIRPYVMAGLGAFNFDPAQVSATPAESSVEFAVNGGAGITLRLFGLEAFIEGRLNNVYTDKGVIDTKSIQMIPVTFGIIF
ncbi:MAG: hypothetical protein ACT4P6_05820 [Gemmatimonadaceae bacterium]